MADVSLMVRQEQLITRQEQMITQMGAMMMQMDARIKALERARVTISHRQAQALTVRIRTRARYICGKYELPQKDETTFRTAIKKAVLKQYGVEDLHDLPLAYMELAGGMIDEWSSYKLVVKVREKHAD